MIKLTSMIQSEIYFVRDRWNCLLSSQLPITNKNGGFIQTHNDKIKSQMNLHLFYDMQI